MSYLHIMGNYGQGSFNKVIFTLEIFTQVSHIEIHRINDYQYKCILGLMSNQAIGIIENDLATIHKFLKEHYSEQPIQNLLAFLEDMLVLEEHYRPKGGDNV